MEDATALARAGYYTRRGIITSPKGPVEKARFLEGYLRGGIYWPPLLLRRALIALMDLFGRGWEQGLSSKRRTGASNQRSIELGRGAMWSLR